jgi:AcrR family transcriptional regulator
VSGPREPGLARLPPGRHGLPREVVARNQRDRLTAGIVASVSEVGFHESTITQIAAAAGVSRRTFYAYFDSKEEGFLATFDQIAAHVRDAAREAAAAESGWPAKVAARFGAALGAFSANPQLAVFTLAVPPRAGGELAERYRDALDDALAGLLDGISEEPGVRTPSPIVQHSLVGGAVALILGRVDAGEGERLDEMLPELVELFLTPFLGRPRAAAAARS